ncbi:MAG: hypothetical protein HY827_06540 [Actinobacteria bacterium]|nr:hypothetical protein [Actinomycetota bacterium]
MYFCASLAAHARHANFVKAVFAMAATVVVALALSTPAQASFGFLNGVNMHGEGSGGMLQFDQPKALARDAGGNFYVAEMNNHRIVKLDPNGGYLMQWGIRGSGDGQLSNPMGVAVNPVNGDVWVADSANHRLQRFSPAGAFLGKVGSFGTGNGQFNYTGGVAVSSTGIVYATDVQNRRVQYFDSSGTYLGQFGSSGSGNGQFNAPSGIALDSDGTVYVVDRFNYRVQYFDATTHAFLGKWGYNSSANGAFVAPSGVFVNTSATPHQVYVTNDYFDNRVQRFSLSGTFLGKWGPEATLSPGSALGDMNSPQGIVVDGTTAYVADLGNYRIEKFINVDTTPTAVSTWGTNGSGAGQLNDPAAVAAAPDGGVYAADTENSRVEHFAADGSYLGSWGEFGTGDGQFDHPRGIAVGAGGAVYVSDYDNDRIQKFSSTGSNLGQWTAAGTYGNLSYPMGIDTDQAGNVWVADGGNQRIVKFDANGNYLTHWGQVGQGDANADFQFPSAVAVNLAGTIVFVVDEQSYRAKKFDGSGSFLASTHAYSGAQGSGPGQMRYPIGVDIDPITGDVLVGDRENNRVQRFDSSLTFLTQYNTAGRGNGEFQNPRGISFDPNGNLWIADTLNDRLQRFGDAPVVQITSPVAGSTLTDATPAVSYTKSDPVATCNLADGGETGPLANGPQSITVTCTNARGSGSATVNVTIDAPLPPAAPASPAAPVDVLNLTLKRKLRAGPKLRLFVTCSNGCTVAGTVKIGLRVFKLKSVRSPASSQAMSVTLRVSKKQLAKIKSALAAKRSVGLSVTLTSPGLAGATATARLR